MAVGAYGAEDAGRVRAELGAVVARECRQRCERGRAGGVPDLDRPVPGAGEEDVFRDEIPVHREDFARVLLPGLYGEVVEIYVK